MEISNLFTLFGVVVTVTIHLGIVSAKISNYMGKTDANLQSLKEQVTNVGSICASCYLKSRIEKVERKQDELREEMPERLATIENDIRHIKEILEQNRTNRTGRHDRSEDL